jgi:ParB-like chromosome segregation protein Spo0J
MGKSLAHHEYARLFPMLDDEAIQELADDIAKNGLRNPIVIDQDDCILDGRNRAAACAIAQVEPVFEPFIGTDEEKLAYVVSANVHRRHLTTSQRASVAAKLLPIYEAQAAKRQQRKPKSVPENLPEQKSKGDSRDKAGAAMNVSGKSVDMAEKVHAKAIPEITAAVDRGEVAVSAAAIVADMPAEEQKQLASKGPKAIRDAAAKARKPSDPVEDEPTFDVNAATSRLCDRARTMIETELGRWPSEMRAACLDLFSGVVEEFK